MKKRILFVDDEENVLGGLRRMLRPLRTEWDMHFVISGDEALRVMAETPFDIIVSDMKMPGMTGEVLLQHIKEKYPNTIRMVLSGQAAEEAVIKSIGPTHQYMSKPCDAEKIQNTIARACKLRETLKEDVISNIVTQINALPSIPDIYYEVMREAELPEASIQKLGELIAKDIGMSAKILQLVNSAFFGIFRQVSSVTDAITLLGLERVKNLILGIHIFNKFDQESIPNFSIDALWQHSMAASGLAKVIVKEIGNEKVADQHILAALLHDIGILILASGLPSEYNTILQESRDKDIPLADVERSHFNTSHAEIGAYLLGLWGMPDAVVEAVAFHHQPLDSLNHAIAPLTTTHLANAFEHSLASGKDHLDMSRINPQYLESLDLASRVEALWEQCRTQSAD